MKLSSPMPVQLRPCSFIASVVHDGEEWALIKDQGINHYWTRFMGGLLVPTDFSGHTLEHLEANLQFALADAPSSGRRR